MSSSAILASLEAQAIEPGSFGHREHLQAAFEALRRDEFLPAANRYSTAIRSFAEAAGAADKFSVTITLAYLSLIAERMESGCFPTFEVFVAANPDLLGNLLFDLYSAGRLHNPLSRRIFLLPDRCDSRLQAAT